MEKLTSPKNQDQPKNDNLESLFRGINEDLRRELHEVDLMLEQSQVEVSRLAQKSGALVAYVKQIQREGKTEELASTCNEALDAQQRYLILRGQVEKLQQVHDTLKRCSNWLEELHNAARQAPQTPEKQQTPLAVLEMLIQAQEAERQRLSRQMHDGPAQALSNFILQTEIAMRLFESDTDKARQELQTLKSAASKTFQQVREFIFDLRPMMLDDLGLAPTLKRYLETLADQLNAEIDIRLLGEERRYPQYLEVFVFRAVQELVLEALRLRDATRVSGAITLEEREVKAQLEDNGTALDEIALEQDEKWINLRLLRERIEMLGGSFTIDSRDGHGTMVSFNVVVME